MRSFFMNIVFYSFTFICAAFALLLSLIAKPKSVRSMLGWYCKANLWLSQKILKAKIIIRGVEHLPKDAMPALLVSKHQSELDFFPIIAMYPDTAAIAMAELARYPLLGPCLRALEYILVSVEGAKKDQLAQVVEGSQKVAAQGRPILIYPEGELMRLGSRERYRTGVYHIYKALNCEVTPIAVSFGLIWPKREWKKNTGQTAVLEFMKPIPAGLDQETFMNLLESTIEHQTMNLIREHGDVNTVDKAEYLHKMGKTNSDTGETRPPIVSIEK